MKHEILLLLSEFHYVCSSSIKNCVYRKKISSDSKSLIAWILIDNIYDSKIRTKKKSKSPKTGQKCMC